MKKLCIVLFASILCSCQNPLEDFILTFKEPISSGLFTFTVRDFQGKIIPEAKLKLTGKDADKLVNSLGNADIKLNEEGRFIVAIKEDLLQDNSESLEFGMQLGAEGYTNRTYKFSVNSRNNRNLYVRLAPLNETVNSATGYTYSYEGNKEEKVSLSNAEAETLGELNLPSEQIWRNLAGESVGSKAQIDLIYFESGGKGFLPLGGIIERGSDAKGNSLKDPLKIGDMPAMIEILATTEQGEIITNFDKPVHMTFSPPEFKTGKIKAGDKITVLSFSDDTGKWIVEGQTAIDAQGRVAVSLNHFSFWILADDKTFETLCGSTQVITVNSTYSDLDISYLYKVKSSTGTQVKSGYLSINNGAKISLKNLPKLEGMSFEIYDYSNFSGGNSSSPVATISGISCLDSDQNFSTSVSLKEKPVPIEVDFAVKCPQGKSLDEGALPSQMKVQISAPGAGQYRDLLTFTRDIRSIKTYKLNVGETYDFRVSTDGGNTWPFKQANYLIAKPSWTINVNTDGYCK